MFTANDRWKCEQLFEKYYTGRKFHDTLYREAIKRHLRSGQAVLDAGCGRYMKVCNELAPVAQMVVGIDLESTLETANWQHPYGVRGDLDHLPFESEKFDIVISRSVVEHLDDPGSVFREFYRVLRSGGKVVIVTPNKYDYVSVIASLTPYSLHRSLVSRLVNVPADDVFPTRYRANTISALRRALNRAGFVERELNTINHYPAYLMFSPLLFWLGVMYERLTSLRPFASLRGSILCVFEKKDTPEVPARQGMHCAPTSIEGS
jgi:ubiquinone/menaquinone biosynthesis C-methylase UbiE